VNLNNFSGRRVPVRVVRYPFVRDGAAQPGV